MISESRLKELYCKYGHGQPEKNLELFDLVSEVLSARQRGRKSITELVREWCADRGLPTDWYTVTGNGRDYQYSLNKATLSPEYPSHSDCLEALVTELLRKAGK